MNFPAFGFNLLKVFSERKLLFVPGILIVTAWVSTFALLKLSITCAPGTSIHINPLLPNRPLVTVSHQLPGGRAVNGILRHKGLECDSAEWRLNGELIATQSARLSSFSGSSDKGANVSFSASSGGSGATNSWAINGNAIVAQAWSPFESLLHPLIPEISGYATLVAVWRKRKRGDHDEERQRKQKSILVRSYGLGFASLILLGLFAYCSIPSVKIPIIESLALIASLGAALWSLACALRVLRGGVTPFSLLTFPLFLEYFAMAYFLPSFIGLT